ncbi:MAG: cobalamin-binding protein, partial [Chloroflexaceae bacterium]|nr:cobalamin-binding protein [Chloroflexaceae bacterium]
MAFEQDTLVQFEQALLSRNRPIARALLQRLQEFASAFTVMDSLVVPVLERIGQAWETGKVALSQVYMAGRICEELIEALFPLEAVQRREYPRIATAVLRDYHVLGKRMVASVLRSSGYHVWDYGHGIEASTLVERVQQDQIDILFISALMLPSAYQVEPLQQQLQQHGCSTRVAVGGAPFRFDSQLWQQVGADAMGYHASDAIGLIQQLR